MFILKTGHQPGVYVPLRALFLVVCCLLLLFFWGGGHSDNKSCCYGNLVFQLTYCYNIYKNCF